MKTKISHLLKNHWSKLLSVSFFILLLGAYVNIFAIDNPFSPGQTLNPNCGPLEANCYIDLNTGGGSNPWLTSSNGIYYDGGGVGVGGSNSNINTQIQGGAVLSNKVLATFESPYQTDVIPAITTDNYGNPVIAYYLGSETEDPFEGGPMTKLINTAYASGPSSLILIHCEDSSCNSFTETNVTENFFSFYVDSEMKPSIAVDSNNRVHIAFFVEGFLAYTICDDGVCTSTDSEEWGDIEPISSTGGNSDNFSLVLDGNDTPYIIYNTEDDDFGNYEVAIAKYTGTGTEDSCSFGGINPNWSCQKVLSDENADYYLDWGSMGDSIQINEDGNPVFISTYEPYIEGNISYITYNECSDSNCSSITTTVIDSVGDAGSSASALSLNNNGVPYIAYIVSPEMDLHLRNNLLNKFALINTAFASTSDAFNIFITYPDQDGSGCSETSDWSCKSLTDAYDPDGEYSGYFTLSMGADDLPQISATGSIQNFDEGIFDVYTDYIKCLNEECSNVTISNILSQSYDLDGERFGPFSPAVSSIVTSSNGSTYLSYINPENLTLNLIKVGSAEDVSFNTSNSLYSGGDLGVSGNLFVDGSIATSNGVYLNSGEPANVNNGLYNVDGELYWNGGPIFQDISSVPYADEAGYAEEAGYVNSANIATRLATYRTIFGYSFNGTSNITGTVSPSYGGTGRSSLTSGSLLVGNGTSAVNLIAPSTAGNVLTSNGSSWSSSALPTRTVAQGGTGRTTLTANNLMVGNGTSNVSFIAPSTAGNVLTSNGSSWTSSALPTRTVAQGGTGLTTLTANNLMVGNGTSNVSFIAPGTSGNVLTSNGISWVSGTSQWTTSGSDIYRSSGDVGIGVSSPTAVLHLKAGTATSGTAPLKLTSGIALTTTEAGAIEFHSGHLYFTATNGGPRYQLDQQGGGLTVGTTGITSGASGNILYNNAGTLGEMTTSGTGTQLALTTSPSFTTPSLGVATATSINGVALSTSAGSTNFLAGDGTYKAVSASLLSDSDFNTKGGTNAGLNLVSGAQYNTFLGYEAGLSSATLSTKNADYNTAIGYRALYSNTTGFGNTANGSESLRRNTTGNNNTANGSFSLYSNTTGYRNTANGYHSLFSNTTGNENTANGYYSLYSNTSGGQNTANGSFSLYYNNSGDGNTANGSYSLYSNTTGTYNIGLGYNSGRYISDGVTGNTTGDYNIFIGSDTKALADDDQNEIVIGYDATGNGSNTATIGNTSLLRTYLTGVNLKAGTSTAGTAPLKLSAGTNLTTTEAGAIEYDGTHLYFTATNGGPRHQLDQQGGGLTVGTTGITSGTSGNILYNNAGTLGEMTTSGTGTQLALTTSPSFTTPSLGVATATSINNLPLSQDNTNFNVKVGRDAGLNLVSGAQYNTFLGYEAGLSSATLSTNAADRNTAVGYRALYSNTTGINNTANGYSSLRFNTTGSNNTANGSSSLFSNTTGYHNTANGSYSLSSNTTGYHNTANGSYSLSSNTTGINNTANGSYSLYSNTTGSYNTANGYYSLYSNTTGINNTANGYYSLYSNTTGFDNTANGYRSLYFNVTGHQNTANGHYSLYNSGKKRFAGSFITGVSYTIQSSGDTDFTLCGASNSNVGTVFTATGSCFGFGAAGSAISNNINNNIGIGFQSGMYIANGSTELTAPSNSIFLGADTKALQDGSSNEIVIGYNAIGNGSNTATWGATSITNHYFSGNVQYSSYGAGTLTTDASGNITTSSDERLKDIIGYYDNNIDNTNNTDTDNITEIQKGALERIIEINPIIYKWNEKSGLETEHSYVGFSAQNLQLAIPEAVGLDKRIDPETGENYLTISDRPILATVVNAIKELNLKVEAISFDEKNSGFFSTILTKIEDGVAYLTNLVVDTIEIGSSEKPTGIILYSQDGTKYCLFVDNSGTSITEQMQEGDTCPKIIEQIQDQDGDGIEDEIDNCPSSPNEGQEDEDEDGIGDICEEETSNSSTTGEQEDSSGEEESGEFQTEENTTDENNNIQTGEEESGDTTNDETQNDETISQLEQPESLELDPIATS